MGVTKVDTVIGCSVIVAFRSLSADDDRMGIARADGDLVSAAKATLDALNRYVTHGPRAAAGRPAVRSALHPQRRGRAVRTSTSTSQRCAPRRCTPYTVGPWTTFDSAAPDCTSPNSASAP